MLHSSVYISIFLLVNLNYLIECGGKRQTLCPKELNAFSVPKTTGNASSDTRPNICSSNTSCCNKSIENEMRTQISKRLMNLIHGRNERARRQFKDVYNDLKGLFESGLEKTSKSAIESLKSQVTRDVAQRTKPLIHTLFDDLRTSVTRKDLHVQNSTTTFFRNFYPIVYRYTVVRKKLPEAFAECLENKMNLILPFKDVPKTLAAFLVKKLQPVQLMLRNLQTIGDVLDVIDNVQLSHECTSALVKMSYCSLCDGFSDVKPCPEYCTTVLYSCLEPYYEIEHEWSSFINKMENFHKLLAKSLDVFAMFTKLQTLISDSISHASHSKVATKVFTHCRNITAYNGNTIISRKQQADTPRDLGNGDLYLTTDVQNSYQHLPTAVDIEKDLMFLRRNLSDIKDYMKMFHINLCFTDNLSTSPGNADKCWLGTSVGREKHHKNNIINNNAALQPENSKTIEDDVSLFLRKAISDIQRIKNRPVIVSGSGDGSGSGEGSAGSGQDIDPNSGTDCNDDDEDCSGESSGVESTKPDVMADEPAVTDGKTERTVITTVISPNSGASTLSQTLVVVLLLLYITFPR